MNVKRSISIVAIVIGLYLLGSVFSGRLNQNTTNPDLASTSRTEVSISQSQVQTQKPTEHVIQSSREFPTIIPSTLEPTILPTLEPTPESVEAGVSRSNPLTLGSGMIFKTWAITVTGVLRGEEAQQAITKANQFNTPPDEGYEYILATVQLRNISDKQEAQNAAFAIDIRVTGERNVLYNRASVVTPRKIDGELYSTGTTEGEIAFQVPKDERNLMFFIGETLAFDVNARRFVAIDTDAHVEPNPALGQITATDKGVRRDTPASRGITIMTDNWEIALLEIVRGDEAANLITQANQFNEPAKTGTEYIAIKIHARYIGIRESDTAKEIDSSSFKITGEQNVVYEKPSIVAPQPVIQAYLFPGGGTEGWVVLSVAKDERKLVVIFKPVFSFSNQETRFLSIE